MVGYINNILVNLYGGYCSKVLLSHGPGFFRQNCLSIGRGLLANKVQISQQRHSKNGENRLRVNQKE